jgi:hypothetical protein
MTVNRENSQSITADLRDFAPAGDDALIRVRKLPVSLPASEE